jgi:hypothetical protein
VSRRFSNSGETAMKNLIFFYRFEAKQKPKAHQEKNEAKKGVRFFCLCSRKGAKRDRFDFEAKVL